MASPCTHDGCVTHALQHQLKTGKVEWQLKTAFVLTVIVFNATLFSGVLFNSIAVLSDAGHLGLDVLLSALTWWIASKMNQKPSTTHTFGYGRYDWGGNFAGNLGLVIIEAVALLETLFRLVHPEQTNPIIMLTTAIVGVTINTVIVLVVRTSKTMSGKAAFNHALGDLLNAVAIAIGGICSISGNQVADPLVALFVISIIVIVAVRQGWYSFSMLMGATPKAINLFEFSHEVRNLYGVKRVSDIGITPVMEGITLLNIGIGTSPISVGEQLKIEKLIVPLAQSFGFTKIVVQFYNVEKAENEHRPYYLDVKQVDFNHQEYDITELSGDGLYVAKQHGLHYHLNKLPDSIKPQAFDLHIKRLEGDGFYEIRVHGDHCHFRKVTALNLDATNHQYAQA